MFKLFKKKETTSPKCPECITKVSVYPDSIETQEQWESQATKRPPVVLGELFSIHEPYPYTGKELMENSYKEEVIKIAQRQFQESQENYLPFPIR